MLSTTRQETIGPGADTPADTPADTTADATIDRLIDPSAADPSLGRHVQAFDGPVQGQETRRGHSRRMARRTRLHGYALLAVALAAFVIALAASNTARVKVSWLFGSSHVSLVWLVLAAAILGWLLGLVTNAALHRRTRAPRPAPGPRT
ncbi:MAG TPA: LapA family protein [Solirubrobacteraceae bacterium]|jgi:uncharacterized integral membrane protein